MKTLKEIFAYLQYLEDYRKTLIAFQAPDNEINLVNAEINTILWILH